MYLLWRINSSSFNGCVSISDGCLYGSIGIMDILELEKYAQKWWYSTLIFFVLGLMAEDRANFADPLLYPNSLHGTFGETVPTLYPRALVYFGGSMIGMVLGSALLSAI